MSLTRTTPILNSVFLPKTEDVGLFFTFLALVFFVAVYPATTSPPLDTLKFLSPGKLEQEEPFGQNELPIIHFKNRKSFYLSSTTSFFVDGKPLEHDAFKEKAILMMYITDTTSFAIASTRSFFVDGFVLLSTISIPIEDLLRSSVVLEKDLLFPYKTAVSQQVVTRVEPTVATEATPYSPYELPWDKLPKNNTASYLCPVLLPVSSTKLQDKVFYDFLATFSAALLLADLSFVLDSPYLAPHEINKACFSQPYLSRPPPLF